MFSPFYGMCVQFNIQSKSCIQLNFMLIQEKMSSFQHDFEHRRPAKRDLKTHIHHLSIRNMQRNILSHTVDFFLHSSFWAISVQTIIFVLTISVQTSWHEPFSYTPFSQTPQFQFNFIVTSKQLDSQFSVLGSFGTKAMSM